MTTLAELTELFSKKEVEVDIKVNYLGVEQTHRLREANDEIDLEYRRRSSQVKVTNREARAGDQALDAPRWLYDAICQSVTAETEEGPQDIVDFKSKIPPDLKCAIVEAYLNRFKVKIERTNHGES